MQLLSLDYSTLPSIRTLYCWVLSKEVSRTIFLSLWLDSTWDWNLVSRTIGKHSTNCIWIICNGWLGRVFVSGLGDWLQSQVKLYQRLKKWYLIPPCLTLSIIRYVSRVKWSNPGKGEVPSFTHQCNSYWKGSLRVGLNYGRQLYLLQIGILDIVYDFKWIISIWLEYLIKHNCVWIIGNKNSYLKL